MTAVRTWTAVDPFDLPEWIGTHEVTWSAHSPMDSSTLRGTLTSDTDGAEICCDLVAADTTYPRALVDAETRYAAHRAWQLGQVHLADGDGRLTLAVPTTRHSADEVLEAVGRMAQAVGAPRERFSVRLRAGQ
ncbi:hypothetical protein E8D34_08320 [Nocardioides sp. GY 10113]|uniref:hypothetical protein n=1 Tax=Nocardioides sp. GY 10113 TaxID=2569761 RepID=UPI0010A85D68|nr:hypothetical protein [Nocardioides sp. GY 10113]TIC87678.1 hypothetical protein E8D34_08320 [Nocardioides sp. GY 10113]